MIDNINLYENRIRGKKFNFYSLSERKRHTKACNYIEHDQFCEMYVEFLEEQVKNLKNNQK